MSHNTGLRSVELISSHFDDNGNEHFDSRLITEQVLRDNPTIQHEVVAPSGVHLLVWFEAFPATDTPGDCFMVGETDNCDCGDLYDTFDELVAAVNAW